MKKKISLKSPDEIKRIREAGKIIAEPKLRITSQGLEKGKLLEYDVR